MNYYIFTCFLLIIKNASCFQLNMNAPKITPWNSLQFSLKERARSWFINNAVKKGIPWNELTTNYKKDFAKINSFKYSKENRNMKYPDYYLMPFHGYDEGNMNWDAANEAESATLSIAAGYWKNVDPYVAQEWMRQNITENILTYIEDVNGLYEFSPNKILDIGCSIGISTEYIQKGFPKSEMFGIDLSPYFIGVASYRSQEKDLGIQYFHENAENSSFPSNYFDVIVCNFLFHELPEDAAKKILNEAYRMVPENGVLVIIDMDPDYLDKQLDNNLFRKWAFEATEPHIYNYYKRNMSKMMYNTGFKRIRKMKNDPLNSLWLGVKRNERYETKDVISQRFEKSLEDLYGANLDDDWTPGSNIMNGDYVGYGKKMYV